MRLRRFEAAVLSRPGRPSRLSRLWLNGNGSQTLVHYGLSRPRAIAVAPAGFYALVTGYQAAIPGLCPRRLPYPEDSRAWHRGVASEPRGIVMRSDATLVISLEAVTANTDDPVHSGASARRRGRSSFDRWCALDVPWGLLASAIGLRRFGAPR